MGFKSVSWIGVSMPLSQLSVSTFLPYSTRDWGNYLDKNLKLDLFSYMKRNLFTLLFKFVIKMSKYCYAFIAVPTKAKSLTPLLEYFTTTNLDLNFSKFQLVLL